MSPHSSVLGPEDVALRDTIEQACAALEGIVFSGLSIRKNGPDIVATLLTLGTDNLDVAQVQLAVVVSILEAHQVPNPEVQLVRGVRG